MRIWAQVEFLNENILILTDDSLIVGTVPRSEVKAAGQEIEKGTPFPKVLGQTYWSIPLANLEAVHMSNNDAKIQFGVREGRRQIEKVIQMAQPRQRDVFAALQEQLGDGWKETKTPGTLWEAVGAPFWCWVLVALFTVLGGLGSWPQIDGGGDPNAPFWGLLAFPLPGGIWVAGGLISLGLVVWAIIAAQNPPPAAIMIERLTKR